MNKKVISFGTALVVLFLVLANVPSVVGHVPGSSPGDPALDASEVSISGNIWSFYYGHSAGYGPYIRDVQWCNNSWELYVAMASVPWVEIDYNEIELPSGTSLKNHRMFSAAHYLVWFNYALGGGTLNVSFELYDKPGFAPNTAKDAWINIQVAYSPSGVAVPVMALFRVDFDLCGLETPGNDNVDAYETPPIPGGSWHLQDQEITYSSAGPYDPTYGMKVIQYETPSDEGDNKVPWAGIQPFSVDDAFDLIRYNSTSNEYKGDPNTYVNDEDIDPEDIVIWYQNYPISSATPIDIDIWMNED